MKMPHQPSSGSRCAGYLRLGGRVPLLSCRQLLWFLAMVAGVVSVLAVFLSPWLHLNPCYLCIVQRILVFGLAICFALAAVFYHRAAQRILVLLSALISLGGMVASGFQSWEQWYPELLSCTGTKPNLIELAVERLGDLWPFVFMPSGLCHNKELVILGLSLANWSFVAFTGFGVLAFIFLFGQRSSQADGMLAR